ncbi:MAG: NADH:flavin oxidoreductase [Asgard group archaeon]|nr:NADH:flavin oxidoreductase [Asgard group archaeon]
MYKLFSAFRLGKLELKNRFVRSATTSYWSDEQGILTDPILDYYEQLATGDIGLIIKGHSYINEKGKAHTGQSGLTDEIHIPRMKKLVEKVHSHGSKIIAQLNHGGGTSPADRATASVYKTENWEARELTLNEIEEIEDDFVKASVNAIEAGFDGVQIHGAHGYLVSQFLSDIVNKREDKFGGTLEKRTRLLFDIYDKIRSKLGSEAIVGIKINCDDFAPEKGLRISDSIQVAKWLSDKGIDFIEISGGGFQQKPEIRKTRGRAGEESGYNEATWGEHAKNIRDAVPKLPLILVDGIRSRNTMEELIENKIVDLISMSKPFINEPDFVKLLQNGQEKSSCIDCRKCISREFFGKTMLRCFHRFP